MPKLSLLIHLNAYSDSNSSNAPSLSNFKWTRDISGLPASNPVSAAFQLNPGETRTLYTGQRTLSGDGTTQYGISLKPLSSSNYRIQYLSGTPPLFKPARTTGADATTQITVVTNGPIVTFSSTAGTPLNLAGVSVGDLARIGSEFNILNQGEWKIIAKSATSFTVENEVAVNEGPITLGSDFANQILIYGASGVQKGDTIVIQSGFSPVTLGSYSVTDVTSTYVEFYSTNILPTETGIVSTDLAIYSAAKGLIYLESDQNVGIQINGNAVANVEPFVINNSTCPGVFMLRSTVWTFTITNNSLNVANLFVASIE